MKVEELGLGSRDYFGEEIDFSKEKKQEKVDNSNPLLESIRKKKPTFILKNTIYKKKHGKCMFVLHQNPTTHNPLTFRGFIVFTTLQEIHFLLMTKIVDISLKTCRLFYCQRYSAVGTNRQCRFIGRVYVDDKKRPSANTDIIDGMEPKELRRQ